MDQSPSGFLSFLSKQTFPRALGFPSVSKRVETLQAKRATQMLQMVSFAPNVALSFLMFFFTIDLNLILEKASFRKNPLFEIAFHSEWPRNTPIGPHGPIPPKGPLGPLGP